MSAHNHQPLEKCLQDIAQQAQTSVMSIRDILHILSGKSAPVLFILLSLPFCQPIQIPGFSIPFGLVICLIGIRMALRKRMWLPKILLNKQIPSPALTKLIEKSLWVIQKCNRFLHPRLIWTCHHPVMQTMNGVLIFLLGLCLAVPIPVPLSNLTAAWAVLLIGLGILKDDGVFLIIGYFMTLITLVFFAFMIVTIKLLLVRV